MFTVKVAIRKMRSALLLTRRFFYSQRFGVDPAKIYANEFYEHGGFDKTERSSEVISEWIVNRLAPSSLADFGSGSGHYLRALESRGVTVLGLEASPAGVSSSGQAVLAITHDLRKPIHLSRKFDAVMCVEVAEHIPGRFSQTLVDSICRNAARFVIFTAAPPGTPRGTDHINCRPEEYWIELFRKQGFVRSIELTDDLRRVAKGGDTAEWWKSWAWCFQRESSERKSDRGAK